MRARGRTRVRGSRTRGSRGRGAARAGSNIKTSAAAVASSSGEPDVKPPPSLWPVSSLWFRGSLFICEGTPCYDKTC